MGHNLQVTKVSDDNMANYDNPPADVNDDYHVKPRRVFYVVGKILDNSDRRTTVGITLTRHFVRKTTDPHGTDVLHAATWTRTIFCKANPNQANREWNATIPVVDTINGSDVIVLPKGSYTLLVGDEKDSQKGLQSVVLDVQPTTPGLKPAANLGRMDILISINETTISQQQIRVQGTVAYQTVPVHFCITPIDENGVPRGLSAYQTKTIPSNKWDVSFFPTDIGVPNFGGRYAFSATSYEGQVAELIEV